MTIRTIVTTSMLAVAITATVASKPARADVCEDITKALKVQADRFNILKPEGALSRCASLGRLSWAMWSMREVALVCQGTIPTGKMQSDIFESMAKSLDAQIEGQCK